MTEGIAIAPAQPALTDALNTASPPTEETMSAKQTIQTITKTWKSSILLKIISGVVVIFLILAIIFLCTTVNYSSGQTNCTNDYNKEKSKAETCEKNTRTLNERITTLENELRSEKQKTSQLQSDLTKCNNEKKTLEDTIKTKDSEISKLTSENTELHNEVNNLHAQISTLNNEINEKNNEINHLKEEVHTKDAEIVKIKGYLTYYQWGLVGSGVVHVGVIIDDIVTHSHLTTAKLKVETLDAENKNLHGQITNCNNQVSLLQIENKGLKEEIEHVNGLRQLCQQDLAAEREKFNECKRNEEGLIKQISVIPTLALNQAKLEMLLEADKKTMPATLVYNSTEDGFHKPAFLNKVGNRKPTVVIATTTSGYVFGGSINIEWMGQGGYQTDGQAFTFSTTNNKICKIKTPTKAVAFNDDHFLEFGDPEFWIDKSDGKTSRGNAEADHVYDCQAKDKQMFYNDGLELIVKELLVYHVEIHNA